MIQGQTPHLSVFPDGQPHVSVPMLEEDNNVVDLFVSISSSDDLLAVLLTADAAYRAGADSLRLHIGYLLGGRMDRPMPVDERGAHPFTLAVVARVLKTVDWERVTLFDPHSKVSSDVFESSGVPVTVVEPRRQIEAALALSRPSCVVLPDKGAFDRYRHLVGGGPVVMEKVRDPANGKLSGFKLADSEITEVGRSCLIVDDLCDGGGTFAGQAAVLREKGAEVVDLYVSHGVFSKGLDIEGIDHIYTTDSYQDYGALPPWVTVFPWNFPWNPA